MTKLNPQAQKVLQFLADEYSEDFGCYSFAGIMSGAGINDRAAVRRACRLLARKGLARYERSLWSDDGEPRGAGYGATKAGVEAIYGPREPKRSHSGFDCNNTEPYSSITKEPM